SAEANHAHLHWCLSLTAPGVRVRLPSRWRLISNPAVPGDGFLGGFYDLLGSEAEFFQQRLQRRGRAEGVHSDSMCTRTSIVGPSYVRCLLDRHPRSHLGRQHLRAIGFRLPFEELPRRHTHHPGANPFRLELLEGLDAE